MKALEAAAQHGDVTALMTLADKYKRGGDDVERDTSRSNALYCKAAARGNVDAILELGLIYASGREMLPNEGVGALLINMAAERGSERAKEILPYIGRGVGFPSDGWRGNPSGGWEPPVRDLKIRQRGSLARPG